MLTCLGLQGPARTTPPPPCNASGHALLYPKRTLVSQPSPHTPPPLGGQGKWLVRSYPTLFDGFFKQLHHIGSLHAARFKSLCPGDQDGLHRRAQRGWKRARRPPQPPGPWGACSRPGGGHIPSGNRPRLFSPVYPPTQCISQGAATGKKPCSSHSNTVRGWPVRWCLTACRSNWCQLHSQTSFRKRNTVIT